MTLGELVRATAQAHKEFYTSLKTVAQHQEQLLLSTIRKNVNSVFGKEHGFSSIQDIQDFQNSVPIRSYEDFEPYIQRIMNGDERILCEEDVLLLEPTSGTSAVKYIPFTASLRSEFQRGISAWLHEIAQHTHGNQYWSISPRSQRLHPPSAVPIGFANDLDYLTSREAQALRKVMSTPSEMTSLEPEAFRYTTQLHLLADETIDFISIWSPSFLPALFLDLDSHKEDILKDLSEGSNSRAPQLRVQATTRRIHDLEQLFAENSHAYWPDITISCWTEGSAAPAAHQLQQWIPQAQISPKGLLATEGLISIPHDGELIFSGSHFTEFAQDDTTYLAHELTPGEDYRVIITTGGGLYRYDLGDIISVRGYRERAPILEFKGRSGRISDLAGEKLSEASVNEAYQRAQERTSIKASFLMIAPNDTNTGYHLYTEVPGEQGEQLRASIEEELNKHYHYAHAREQRQLQALQRVEVRTDAHERYQQIKIEEGMKLGDIKPPSLELSSRWKEVLI